MDSIAFRHPQDNTFIIGNQPLNGSLKPELLAGIGSVTILTVAPQARTYYSQRRTDPIFPAMDRTSSGSYTNNSTRGHALGCVDYVHICDARNVMCWDNSNVTHAVDAVKSRTAKNALFLLLFGLERSNAYFSMVWNDDLLNETTSAMLFYQDRLHEEQWKVEAEVLFQLSLARIRVEIFDLARGTYKDAFVRKHSQIVNNLPKEFRGVCSMVKFHAEGYKNVNALGFWGINSLCVLVFVASRRRSSAEREPSDGEVSGNPRLLGELWATIFLQKLCDIWLPFMILCLYQRTRCLVNSILVWVRTVVQ